MKFIKENFQFVVIIGLILLLLTKGCRQSTTNSSVIIHDTTRSVRIDTIKSVSKTIINPVAYVTEVVTSIDTIYQPDTSYAKLLNKFNNLKDSLLSIKSYSIEHKLDTIGSVTVNSKVLENNLVSQSVNWAVKIPTITNTITIKTKEPARRILYIGAGIEGNKQDLINQVNFGLLYKDRKDRIIGTQAGISVNGVVNYGISAYTPIKLRKR
jgi:hypothetical protein